MQIFHPAKLLTCIFPRQQNKTNPEATITNTTYISEHHQFLISGALLNL